MAGEAYAMYPKSAVRALEQEAVRLHKGWSDAEAQIAVLRDENAHLAVELAHRVGWEERALLAEEAVLVVERAHIAHVEGKPCLICNPEMVEQ